MDSKNLVLLLAAALLISGCVCTSPPVSATPTPEPTPAPTPTPAPRCGDSACNGNEGSLANCCTDCGCQANYVCDNTTKACHPDARYLRDMAAESMANESGYTSRGETVTVLTTRIEGTEIRNTTRKSDFAEVNLTLQQMHTTTESGAQTTEGYVFGNTTYMSLSTLGWVKDETAPDYWQTLTDMSRFEKKILNRATDMSYLGSGNFGGEGCYWFSIQITDDSVDDMKKIIAGEVESLEGYNYTLTVPAYHACVSVASGNVLAKNMTMEFNLNLTVRNVTGSVQVVSNQTSTYTYDEVIIILPSAVRNAQPIPVQYKVRREYCGKIDPTLPTIRTAAIAAIGSGDEGSLNYDQLIDQYAYVKAHIRYVSDPNRPELETYPYSPAVTLANGAGDCDDQAALLASMVEAIGGTARVMVSFDCGHAYVEAYIGNNNAAVDAFVEAVDARYPGTTVLYTTDDDGTKWALFDPAGADAPGELHSACYSTLADGTWREAGTPITVYSCKGS